MTNLCRCLVKVLSLCCCADLHWFSFFLEYARVCISYIKESSLVFSISLRDFVVIKIQYQKAIPRLVDQKSGPAMNKAVEQIGFLSRRLQRIGGLYSRRLLWDCLSLSLVLLVSWQLLRLQM